MAASASEPRNVIAPLRVVVIGASCAGKTTFAEAAARVLDCPRIELDELFWTGNRIPRAQGEFLHLVGEAAGQERG
jgi:adenylate kinase family enzyme